MKEKISRIIIIASGGAIGSVFRYVLSYLFQKASKGMFPWGTLLVNLSGALVLGFLWGVCETTNVSFHMRTFLFVGILGAYTTFSTFCLENFSLVRNGEYIYALVNVLASNILGILLVFLGYFASKSVLGFLKCLTR